MSASLRLRAGSLRLRPELIRSGHGRLLGAEVLEQHAAVLEILLGQAGAGPVRRGRDRSGHLDRSGAVPPNHVMVPIVIVVMIPIVVVVIVIMVVVMIWRGDDGTPDRVGGD